jgi:hypothetical protein
MRRADFVHESSDAQGWALKSDEELFSSGTAMPPTARGVIHTIPPLSKCGRQ